MNSSSNNFPIEMRLEWRLMHISAYFAWLDKFFSDIWDWCVNAVVYELGSFKLIRFSDDYLVSTIVVRASI